ncbi:MAG: flagellin, partial [Luminiphilus sp.]
SVTFGTMVGGGSGSPLSGTVISGATTAAAQTAASAAMTGIDSAIENVSNQRASFGAAVNQLTHAIDNLTQVSINAASTRSRIMDTDYAHATSELAKTQIIQQAGTAMLAQANQLPANVLDLLK